MRSLTFESGEARKPVRFSVCCDGFQYFELFAPARSFLAGLPKATIRASAAILIFGGLGDEAVSSSDRGTYLYWDGDSLGVNLDENQPGTSALFYKSGQP